MLNKFIIMLTLDCQGTFHLQIKPRVRLRGRDTVKKAVSEAGRTHSGVATPLPQRACLMPASSQRDELSGRICGSVLMGADPLAGPPWPGGAGPPYISVLSRYTRTGRVDRRTRLRASSLIILRYLGRLCP
jgi:hypothetical protein